MKFVSGLDYAFRFRDCIETRVSREEGTVKKLSSRTQGGTFQPPSTSLRI